jgi:hypothetical protein
MTTIKEMVITLISLFQSLVRIVFIVWLNYYFREDIKLLRVELQRRIKSGEQIESGPLRLRKVEEKVTNVEHDVKITKQFLLSMSKSMYDNLVKIASGNFGRYKMEMGSGLQRELYHLRDISYIDIFSIRNIPNEGINLSDYVKIKPIGEKFMELRENSLSWNE